MEDHKRAMTADRPISPQVGKNKWRVVKGPWINPVHWVPVAAPGRENPDELVSVVHRIVCPSGNERAEVGDECPICAVASAETAVLTRGRKSRLEASPEYLFLIIDRDEQKKLGKTVLRKARVPWMVYKSLKELYDNPQYGMWCEYDITITKAERRNQPPELTVVADRENKDFTDEEVLAIETSNLDFDFDMEPLSGSEIRKLLIDHPVDLSRADYIKDVDVVKHALDEEGIPYVGGEFEEGPTQQPRTNPSAFTPRGQSRGVKSRRVGQDSF
jgi:hypothetical protein